MCQFLCTICPTGQFMSIIACYWRLLLAHILLYTPLTLGVAIQTLIFILESKYIATWSIMSWNNHIRYPKILIKSDKMIKLECEETINMREAGVAEPESSHQNSRSLFLSVFTILHKYPLITDISNKLLLIFMANYTKKINFKYCDFVLLFKRHFIQWNKKC